VVRSALHLIIPVSLFTVLIKLVVFTLMVFVHTHHLVLAVVIVFGGLRPLELIGALAAVLTSLRPLELLTIVAVVEVMILSVDGSLVELTTSLQVALVFTLALTSVLVVLGIHIRIVVVITTVIIEFKKRAEGGRGLVVLFSLVPAPTVMHGVVVAVVTFGLVAIVAVTSVRVVAVGGLGISFFF